MALLEIKINLERVADALERIAVCAERAFPPPIIPDQTPKKHDKDSLVRVTPEQRWQKQMDKKIEKANKEGIPLDELGLM